MAEQKQEIIGGYQEIGRGNGERFPYVVGRFQKPGVYVVGVMDLTDPKSWSGEGSDVTLYFMITPEEFDWLKTDRPKLDVLASRIQDALPKNRYLTGTIRKRVDQAEFHQRCQELLQEESLEDDTAFDDWKKKNLIHTVRQEKSPLTVARRELSEFQKRLKPVGVLSADRQEEQRRQRTLGFWLREAEHLYVAMDRCSPGNAWPGLEPRSGDAFLYTSEELARSACEYYEVNHIFYYTPQEVLKADYPQFFQNCEMLGIQRFRVDDGIEPVELERKNIFPDQEMSWLEEKNQALRNAMLHSVSLSTQSRLHMGGYGEKERQAVLNWGGKWRTSLLRNLHGSLLYALAALPEELAQNFQGNYMFTQRALDQLRQDLKEHKRPESALTPPGFSGKVMSIKAKHNGSEGKEGRLPLRVLTTNEDERWILAFTSEQLCRAFMEAHHHQDDTMMVFTLEELAAQMDEVPGILLDFLGLGVQLRERDIQQVRRVGENFSTKKPENDKIAPPERKKPEVGHVFETAPEPEVESASAPAPESPEQTQPETVQPAEPQIPERTEEKQGFFDKLLHRNRKKKQDGCAE